MPTEKCAKKLAQRAKAKKLDPREPMPPAPNYDLLWVDKNTTWIVERA